MDKPGREPLGPFALYIVPPTWVAGQPKPAEHTEVAWEGLGVRDVPLTALRNGFIIFEFDRSVDYAGGAVPAYTLPEDRRMPQQVATAERERDNLAYRRFVYMNAFLLALYSGFSTVQRIAMPVQEPADPTNYFGARRTANGWQTFMNVERKVNYPRRRSHDVQIPTLDHALGILQRFHDAINPSLDVPSLIYAACHQYARHQFSSAHLIAWAAIEALLNVIWMNLWAEVDVSSGGHTKVNRDRKKILTGRDYTASIVSQILSICQKIDDQTLTRLDQARRKRNDFAHKLVPIESGDAGKAIRLATDMITSITGVRVTSQLSMSFWL